MRVRRYVVNTSQIFDSAERSNFRIERSTSKVTLRHTNCTLKICVGVPSAYYRMIRNSRFVFYEKLYGRNTLYSDLHESNESFTAENRDNLNKVSLFYHWTYEPMNWNLTPKVAQLDRNWRQNF